MQAKGIRLNQTAEQLREYLADSATSEVVMSTHTARQLLLRLHNMKSTLDTERGTSTLP